MKGAGPPRRKDPQDPYGWGSVSADGSHRDVCLLNVGGLALYVGSYAFGLATAERLVLEMMEMGRARVGEGCVVNDDTVSTVIIARRSVMSTAHIPRLLLLIVVIRYPSSLFEPTLCHSSQAPASQSV